jgi:hypothetical protein
MKSVAMFAATLLLYQANGCDQSQSAPKPPWLTKSERHPIHRFENVPTVGASGIALDTVTGQWCRTWDWVPRNPNAPLDGLSTVPTCIGLYRDYPSSEQQDVPDSNSK